MADMIITPAKLHGSVRVPASKSMCHRAVICAGLAQGTSILEGVTLSDDITATLEGMHSLGAVQSYSEPGKLVVRGAAGVRIENTTIDCGESGSTLRFLIPLVLLSSERFTFTGRGRLTQRPLNEYAEICQQQGLVWESKGGLPVTVKGRLQAGEFTLRGDVSSQFLSGLLFALPLLDGDSVIRLTTPLESRGYVDLTLAALSDFGVTASHTGYQDFIVPGNQAYQARYYRVEGDYSQAAFWLVAGTIGKSVHCLGLSDASLQGDKVIQELITGGGGRISSQDGIVTAAAAETRGTIIDAADCPDLVPVLAVLAAVSSGETRIIRASRLRLKESDRLTSTARELAKLGADIREAGDSLIINGKPELAGGEVDSWQDHRIAMALAIASIRCRQPVIIRGADCVSKSYPEFWRDFISLGGEIRECGMG